jgi:lipoprotein-anchoring transpeptidase ErfK/SrfK
MQFGTFTSAQLRAILIAILAVGSLLLLMVWYGKPPASANASISAPEASITQAVAGEQAAPQGVVVAETRGAKKVRACAEPTQIVYVEGSRAIRTGPGRGRRMSILPKTSLYLGTPLVMRVLKTSDNGRYGKVVIPWDPRKRTGWMALSGLHATETLIRVKADISKRRLKVMRGCKVVFTAPMTVGRPGSPSPSGRFHVTDRTAVPANQSYYGSFAFGISGVQPNLPSGWSGGNQMAIHGTNQPSSIGRAASAGCLRVSEKTLKRLKPLLEFGTPVDIHP